jgi:hypothetical protein
VKTCDNFGNVAAAARHAIAHCEAGAGCDWFALVDRAVVVAATSMLKSGGEAANKQHRPTERPIHLFVEEVFHQL